MVRSQIFSFYQKWMQAIYWKIALKNVLNILLSNMNNCGKTISLKDLTFASTLNTITSCKICSQPTKINNFLTDTFSLVSRVQVPKKWFLSNQPQPNNRVQLSIQQTPDLRQVQTNHQSMKSTSLCESPHRESAQHQHLMHLDLLSIRLLNRASSLWVCRSQHKTRH